jgi:hypothetical protein
MGKTRLNDFSTNADDNTDVDNVGISGSSLPSNLDNGVRSLMKLIKAWIAGTPVYDTANFCDPDDTTKIFRSDAGNIPAGTTRVIDAEAVFDLSQVSDSLVGLLSDGNRSFITGYTLSNNATDATNDIDIAAGACSDSTSTYAIVRASSITKRLDALWTAGNNQGGLDTGAVADGTYHAFAIKRLDTGVTDILFSASPTAPTLPTNYTVFRRIGSVVRSSGVILEFSQYGNEFLLKSPPTDVDVSNQGLTAVSRTLSVPTGIKVWAKIRARALNAGSWAVLISSLDVNDQAPETTSPRQDLRGAAGESDHATLTVRTNTSGQIRTRSTNFSTDLQIQTYGWIDTRE